MVWMDMTTNYCDIELVSDNTAILRVREGQNMSLERTIALSQQLTKIAIPPLNIIFDRLHQYSFELDALQMLKDRELFKKIIVVSYRAITDQMTELERHLGREDLHLVHSLDAAIKLCADHSLEIKEA
jgi:hypothetical protein